MKKVNNFWRTLVLLLIISLAFAGCNDDVSDGVDEDIETEESDTDTQTMVEGSLELPDGIDLGTLTILSPVGAYQVQADSSFEAVNSGMEKQVLIVENSNGEVLLAALNASSGTVINSSSTARAIVALAPWSGLVDNDELDLLLDEIAQTEAYAQFESAVAEAIENGTSPLTDAKVLEGLQQLFSQSTASGSTFAIKSVSSLPEYDLSVEPQITYSGGSFIIANDGTTTAAWGVEVFLDGVSLTGQLVLDGNKVKFPSLGSIWNFVSGDYADAVFEASEPLEVPAGVDDKYRIEFGSPTGFTLNPDLSLEAATYNVHKAYQVILAAVGIDLEDVKITDFFDEDCVKEIFDATTNTCVAVMKTDTLRAAFLLDQLGGLFASTTQSFTKCTKIINKFTGATPTGVEQYLGKLSNFLDAYSKVEASFVAGKLVGDMIMLYDLKVCRQVIDGDIYPCFTLQIFPEIENDTLLTNEKLTIEVEAQTDFPNADSTLFATGAPIQWEITEGDGTLSNSETTVQPDGIAKVVFTAGTTETNTIKVYVNEDEAIYYTIQVIPNPFIGKWHAFSYNGLSMGEYEKSGYIEECDVYTEQSTVSASALSITENEVSVVINGIASYSTYSSTDGQVICDSIDLNFQPFTWELSDAYEYQGNTSLNNLHDKLGDSEISFPIDLIDPEQLSLTIGNLIILYRK